MATPRRPTRGFSNAPGGCLDLSTEMRICHDGVVMRAIAFALVPLTAVAALAGTPADDFLPVGQVVPLAAPAQARLESIVAAALAAHIRFLASPALEGRGLGSQGLDAAAAYVVAQLELAGIGPLPAPATSAPAGYRQQVPLREVSERAAELTVEAHAAGGTLTRTFLPGVDLTLPELGPVTLGGNVVFASYGICEPALGRDDLAGLEVRGKVALVLGGLPPGEAWQTPELVARYGATETRPRYAAKRAALRRLGAALVLVAEEPERVATAMEDEPFSERVFLPYDPVPYPDDEPPLVVVSPAVADALLAPSGLTFAAAAAARPRELAGVTATLRISGRERLASSCNIVAAIPGSDPKLADTAVVVGAHLDHLGKVGGTVYPGADDNASGVAAVIEIGKAFAGLAPRPRRTVLLAFWTGEEEGKLGSGHWVRHPRWPLARTVAYLNLDMIGHPWLEEEIRKLLLDSRHPDPDTFMRDLAPADFAEPGLPPDRPDLVAALQRAARATGLALHLDRTAGTHGGSDYRDFARAGVGWVRFFGNFFPAYHEPGDTAEALDATQVQRLARLAFATAYLLANE